MTDTYHKTRPEARFVADYQQGTAWRWRSAMSARRIVSRGDVYKVAKELALNHATVQNLAIASQVYTLLRHYAGKTNKVKELHNIRRTLTYSHWVAVGRAMVSHDIPVPELFDILFTASENNATTRDLAEYMMGAYGSDDQNAAMWVPGLQRLIRDLDTLSQNYATPHHIKQRIRDIRLELTSFL